MTIRPTPDDIDLLAQLIEMRNSARLAGHTQDAFNLARFQGTLSLLVSPGRSGSISVSTLAMGRLEDLGLFRVIDRREKVLKFDLVDDVRDRLEEMRVAAGQPSRMGELEAAASRAEVATEAAETARRDLEARVAAAALARADLRAAFARRVARRVRWAAMLVLGALYVSVAVIAGYFALTLPQPAAIVIVVVAIGLALLGWLRHIDGFSLATGIESRVVEQITRWLNSFDVPDGRSGQ